MAASKRWMRLRLQRVIIAALSVSFGFSLMTTTLVFAADNATILIAAFSTLMIGIMLFAEIRNYVEAKSDA